MAKELFGKKVGMTNIFDDSGNMIVCTVLKVEPNVVVSIRTTEKEGYNALQLGAFKLSEVEKKRAKKPLIGYYKKRQVEPRKTLFEVRVKDPVEAEIGSEISVEIFNDVTFVDVIGKTKGKGFQGVMKRHNFRGGPASHGSQFHREHGSTGMCSYPARTFKGVKMAGHMGDEQKTAEKLRVVKIDTERNVLFVKGSVPGPQGALVRIRKAMKV